MDNRPIGIFDSGLGGLTAFRQLRKLLPGEDLIYFGDTGRVPYGTKTRETILRYAMQDMRFLLSHQVKMVISACGTVSAAVEGAEAAELPVFQSMDIPFSGVVEHAARAACSATACGRIGVIGTPATIRSGAYGRTIRRISPDMQVISIPCALFVPLVESGFISRDNQVTRLVARQYLEPFADSGIDTLILGCTHYPIIAPLIQDVLSELMRPRSTVKLIDSGKVTADYARRFLQRNGLLADRGRGTDRFYVSDSVEGFRDVAEAFLGENIESCVCRIDIEEY